MAEGWRRSVAIAAVVIGAIAEAVLVWLVDRLPGWAQWLVYGIPALAIVAGFALALQDRRRRQDGRDRDRRRQP